MRVYIAYKYKAIEDKNQLKSDLQQISDALEKSGHHPFVLGRDVHKWHLLPHSSSKPTISTAFQIILNILRSDAIFAFISSDVQSHGLSFEMLCAKIFNKPVMLAIKNGLSFQNFKGPKPTNTIEFFDINDLLSKISDLSL